ncbi:MAG: hypothetical protein U0835_00960 [Isosphaeraceae bacterium]
MRVGVLFVTASALAAWIGPPGFVLVEGDRPGRLGLLVTGLNREEGRLQVTTAAASDGSARCAVRGRVEWSAPRSSAVSEAVRERTNAPDARAERLLIADLTVEAELVIEPGQGLERAVIRPLAVNDLAAAERVQIDDDALAFTLNLADPAPGSEGPALATILDGRLRAGEPGCLVRVRLSPKRPAAPFRFRSGPLADATGPKPFDAAGFARAFTKAVEWPGGPPAGDETNSRAAAVALRRLVSLKLVKPGREPGTFEWSEAAAAARVTLSDSVPLGVVQTVELPLSAFDLRQATFVPPRPGPR